MKDKEVKESDERGKKFKGLVRGVGFLSCG